MDAILAQLLNGLDKGGAYALIALGLTLVFGTLGVVNFAHGALFMLGAFCAVAFRALITMESVVVDETQLHEPERVLRVGHREHLVGQAGDRVLLVHDGHDDGDSGCRRGAHSRLSSGRRIRDVSER